MKEIKDLKAFNEVVLQKKPVLLDFYADWCPPCKALLPTIEKLAAKYEEEFVIRKINVDKNPELANQFKVRSIPALFVLKDNEIQEQFQGFKSEEFLEEVIQKQLGLAS